jgi:superfamily II DNA or RNA helicase
MIWAVTPGGGKQIDAVIAAHELIPSVVDKLCWVVPNQALRGQAEEEFSKSFTRKLVGHSFSIRQAESATEIDPSRGTAGFAITYQALSYDCSILSQEFNRHKYLLILDEPHHVSDAEQKAWKHGIRELVNRAKVGVFMSGTFERHDNERIAVMDYIPGPYGGFELDTEDRPDRPVITYSRRDALAEKAILPVYFTHMDGEVRWMNGAGDLCEAGSLQQSGNSVREALWCALRTEYADHLLQGAVDQWQSYRAAENPRAKLLVVTADINEAKRHAKALARFDVASSIATSEDEAAARDAIGRFKQHGVPQAIDALVTVQMAYEGLDVPSVSHLVALTHIRSRPWITQMIARATRYDREAGPYDDQYAWVYVPDDTLMVDILRDIDLEQAPYINERAERDALQESERRQKAERNGIVPIESLATNERASELGGITVDAAESSMLKAVMDEHGIHGVPIPLFAKAVQAVRERTGKPGDHVKHLIDDVPPSKRERKLRKEIQRYATAVDTALGLEYGTTNKAVKHKFGASRDTMTEAQLLAVLRWLNKTHPEGRINVGA